MKPRETTRIYQTAARLWLTLATLSALLPAERRVGVWLPVHLAVAGAVASAIAGAMQMFAHTLTATPMPPVWTVRTQFGLLTAGVVFIASGMITRTTGAVAFGGSMFVESMLLLGWMLMRAWRMSLNKRHAVVLASYGFAVASILVGGILGALLGGRAIHPVDYLDVRRIHMTVNVLGFASLTVVGTLVTLLPTVLRVRMVPWRGGAILACLIIGMSLQALGWVIHSIPMLATGGVLYAAGALGTVALLILTVRVERRWAIPVAGMHMIAAMIWFGAGAIALARALIGGPAGFERFVDVFLVMFVGGWLIQVLLGAWSYLLPTMRPGHPLERLRQRAAFELGGRTQVALLNTGLLLMTARAAGLVGERAADAGIILALSGGGVALIKAWCFPLIARSPMTNRARAVWGG